MVTLTLRCSVSFLYQYHHCHVTQPLLLEQLWELGVDISAGQVNRIITEGKECFHREKDEILRTGLQASTHVNVDDTGARHKGKNGYCTHIGNEMFAWFQSTGEKSRMNFLRLLRAGTNDYVLNTDALEYMKDQKLPKAQLERLINVGKIVCEDEAEWNKTLEFLGITDSRHIRIATEGAVLGSVLEHDILNPDLVIVSDDAGQFDILVHALCWIHAERSITKLVGFNDAQREALAEVRTEIWGLYRDLKAYKQKPDREKRSELERRFDRIFTMRTCYERLNQTLKRIHKNKAELLLVSGKTGHSVAQQFKRERHSGIREKAQDQRFNPQRSGPPLPGHLHKPQEDLPETGMEGFWDYLNDRLTGKYAIPQLPDLIWRRVLESPG